MKVCWHASAVCLNTEQNRPQQAKTDQEFVRILDGFGLFHSVVDYFVQYLGSPGCAAENLSCANVEPAALDVENLQKPPLQSAVAAFLLRILLFLRARFYALPRLDLRALTGGSAIAPVSREGLMYT